MREVDCICGESLVPHCACAPPPVRSPGSITSFDQKANCKFTVETVSTFFNGAGGLVLSMTP